MLALTDDTLVAHEPFNIEPWAYALDGLAERWFTYAPALPQDAAWKPSTRFSVGAQGGSSSRTSHSTGSLRSDVAA
jgi:hypothetical protein